MAAPKTPAPEKPRFQVVGDTFIAQTEQGELSIRLRFKFKLLRQLRNNGGDQIDQIFSLLDGINDQETAERLDELDTFEAIELVVAYFNEFNKRQQASMGESSGSSA
jgi:hypothetical protein